MSSRKFASLELEERRQVIDGIYKQLEPQITKAVNEFLSSIEPKMQTIVRKEIGKWCVNENQARAFIDGMMHEAAQKAASYFYPRWFAKLFFRGR